MNQRTADSRLDGFADEYADAIQGLRSALEELVRSAGGDPTRPVPRVPFVESRG